ncbi:MAG: hypothetical protein PF489_04025, partial [Salinivirgaceae bacterium]|nr:hypothetical protein [Salinivirgaceae bacterium]
GSKLLVKQVKAKPETWNLKLEIFVHPIQPHRNWKQCTQVARVWPGVEKAERFGRLYPVNQNITV